MEHTQTGVFCQSSGSSMITDRGPARAKDPLLRCLTLFEAPLSGSYSAMASSRISTRTGQWVARISPEDKTLREQAAGLEATSVAAFIVGHGRPAAEEILRQHTEVRLNQAQTQRFVKALLAPVKTPAKRLKHAIALHRATDTER